MGEPSDRDAEALRTRARERLRQGQLPHTKPARTWGGVGSGLPCDLCGAAILSSEPEFELQLDLRAPSESLRFHRQCHSIWSEVREEYSPANANAWCAVADRLPPFGVHVETRVALTGGRSVILTAVCSRAEPPDPASWINVTTGGPLPEGWCPIEWRHPAPTKSGPATQFEPAPQSADSSVTKRA